MQRLIGVNTWVWVSPLTESELIGLINKVSDFGFQAIELPIEKVGAWETPKAFEALKASGLVPYVVGAMSPGHDLLLDPESRNRTQKYLKHCIEVAAQIGSKFVAGPFYAQTGRSWRMGSAERIEQYSLLQESLKPVLEHAAKHEVALAIEPLNRYETSLINTVEQALEALAPLLGDHLGLALDSYHLNLEEKDPAAAIRLAADHLLHVQVCGTDRGPVGSDHFDWSGFLDALDEVNYSGALNLESFTAENDTIATAASIWRPLASSQDALALETLNFLTQLQESRERKNG